MTPDLLAGYYEGVCSSLGVDPTRITPRLRMRLIRVISDLKNLSPSSGADRFLGLLCAALPPGKTWRGTAAVLTSLLKEHKVTMAGAKVLLYFEGACGLYLSKLADRGDGIVRSRRSKMARMWEITPPTG